MTITMPGKAMVLAAGLGTRMRPLTDNLPKPLIRIAGKTLLDHALDIVIQAKIETAVVNVHYLADQIETHLDQRGSPIILISDERRKLLNSGGGIKAALPLLGKKPFLILNADTFWLDAQKSSVQKMAEFWADSQMDILLLLAPLSSAVGFDGAGDFFMDGENRLARRGDAESAPFAYAGAAILAPFIFDDEKQQAFNLNRQFDAAIANKRLYGIVLDGLWLHVGTPAAIVSAEQAITAWNRLRE